jgi:hypothetical protein
MKISTLSCAFFIVLGSSALQAQVDVHIDIGLPPVPPLVVVQPGIQVVEGFQEEVFFHRGWYWCRRPDGWYRARSPHSRFDWVDVHRVPVILVRQPEGHYRNWHHNDHHEQSEWHDKPKHGHGHGHDKPNYDRHDEDHDREAPHKTKGRRPLLPPPPVP